VNFRISKWEYHCQKEKKDRAGGGGGGATKVEPEEVVLVLFDAVRATKDVPLAVEDMGGVELSDCGPNIPLGVSHLLPCAGCCKKKKKKKKTGG